MKYVKKTGLQGWYRGATWNSVAKAYSGCAILWNTNTLGTMASSKTINLAEPDDKGECDARTCCIINTTEDINLIVAHFPWLTTLDKVREVNEIISMHISSNGPIIILADTNDYETFISKENPLIIKNKALSHGLTKQDAKKHLTSCCWHIKDHPKKYGHFTTTGDYILSENVKNINIPIPIPSNAITETTLYSDHMPVIANVILKVDDLVAPSTPYGQQIKRVEEPSEANREQERLNRNAEWAEKARARQLRDDALSGNGDLFGGKQTRQSSKRKTYKKNIYSGFKTLYNKANTFRRRRSKNN